MDSKHTEIFLGAGAVIGLLIAQYIYATTAEQVRLLFILIFIPIGLLGGAVGGLLLAGLFLLLRAATEVAIIIGVIGGLIYLLYSIVVWRN